MSGLYARILSSFNAQGLMKTMGASLELVSEGEVHIALPLYPWISMFRQTGLDGYPQPVSPVVAKPVGEPLAWMTGRLLQARTVAGWLCSAQACTDLEFARMGYDRRV